jgi:hypothetical protein
MRAPSTGDVLIDGQPYLLARREQLGRGGRAWQVETVGASIAQQTPTEVRYGNQPATIEAPMVFKTAHKGYGDAQVQTDGRYHYTVNVDARFPGMVIPGPAVTTLTIGGTANVNGFFEMDGLLFCIAGRYCKAITADDVVVLSKDFGAGKAATDCAVYNGTAYVGMGYSEAFWQRPTGAAAVGVYGTTKYGDGDVYDTDLTSTWAQASGLYMGHVTPFTDRLWASVTAATVKSTAADPTVASNWTAAYAVGDPSTAITSLAELGDLLYIGKQNGLFTLGSDGIAHMATPELRSVVSGNNCVNVTPWHGSLWCPHVRGLLNYRSLGEQGFAVTPATPGSWVTDDNPVRGRVTAMCGDNRWLYAALLTPDGDTYILAGREAFEGEQGPLVWHPLAMLDDVECHAMHISGLWTNPRLFFGMDEDCGYIVLPRNGENPTQDNNCEYSLSGSIYYPAHSWYAPTTPKLFKSIEVQGENITPARYLDVYYRVDGKGAWTLAGTATRSPRSVISLGATGVAGTWLEVRLDYTLPDATNPFKVYAVVVRGVERPQTIKVITATVRCADNLQLQTRRERRTGAEILRDLEALASANRAVQMVDPLGTERWVIVLPPVGEQESEQDGANAPEMLAQVRMAVFEAEQVAGATGNFGVYGESTYGGTDVYGA